MERKITEKLSTLPDKPGVYLHKDIDDTIIYVGKASSLKNRVRQYFQSKKNMDAKTRAMVGQIHDFEYIVTGNEVEALILENNLIKKYMPKYNILLRDDKTYPYIKVTVNEDYPRVLKTRILTNDGSKYFGPYTDVKSVNTMIDLLNDVFRLKRCSTVEFSEGFKPCLNGHIDKCRMICQGNVDKDEYMKDINAIMAFLKGQDKGVINYLKEKMNQASSEMNYEKAAKYRDYIVSANSIINKQRVEMLSSGDMDIIIASEIIGNQNEANITVFFVRNGRLSGREIHKMHRSIAYDIGENDNVNEAVNIYKSELTAAFIKQYYSSQSVIPKEIILEEHIEDEEQVSQLLSDLQGRKVHIIVPERGAKRDLLKLAQKDIGESLRVQKIQKEKEDRVSQQLGDEFSKLLNIESYTDIDSHSAKDVSLQSKLRLEAYDISHTGGKDSVGAMVVFENNKPSKKNYRRFKIRSEDGADDYSSMQEVLYRRLKRGLDNDPGFLPFPDMLLIDGGIGHVNAVKQVLNGLKLDIPIAGMVKDDKHRTRGLIVNMSHNAVDSNSNNDNNNNGNKEVDLKDFPGVSKLIGNIQEEVHRFVIDYHRGVRGKSTLRSELDDIPGVGATRKMKLIKAFGSIEKIKSANVDDLANIDGMNKKSAEAVYKFFHSES